MSRDFVDRKVNKSHLDEAARQQKQINYFVKSSLQKDISREYLTQWSQREYATDDYFLNFVKTIFKTPNFLTFYKYHRFPSASSRLINEQVKGQLSRVFFSEDKNIRYMVDDEVIACPEQLEHFDDHIMDWLMFRFNDVVITDIDKDGSPFRFLVSIDKISSIEMDGNRISRIAYPAKVGETKGFLYIDDERYIFYPEPFGDPIEILHLFGKCPAMFVSQYPFDESDNTIVRKSMFTYVRADLEEYDFLKTLQKVTEPNGAFPVVTKLKRVVENPNDIAMASGQPEPMSAISSQQSSDRSGIPSSGSDLQVGTIIEINERKKQDGAIDSDIAKNYINFHYIPVEVLENINNRIQEIENRIIVCLLGSHSETGEASKNELQVSLGYVSRQDKLRQLSTHISMIRKKLDKISLSVMFYPRNVEAHVFYGSDFFLETESDVYDLLKKSPNPIESRSLLERLARSKNRFNESQMNRDVLLYKLLPYANSNDFESALNSGTIGEKTMQLQTRFQYWIGMFEANYGDIVYFWNSTQSTDSEKLILINRLLNDLIEANYEKPIAKPNGTPSGV